MQDKSQSQRNGITVQSLSFVHVDVLNLMVGFRFHLRDPKVTHMPMASGTIQTERSRGRCE